MADSDKPNRSLIGDLIAMVSFIGLFVAVSVVGFQVVRDWTGKGLREISHYLGLMRFLGGPFVVGIVIASLMLNRNGR